MRDRAIARLTMAKSVEFARNPTETLLSFVREARQKAVCNADSCSLHRNLSYGSRVEGGT